ncbi:MAG: hypothetical protein HY070_04170, partial [Chloroflexi bacterium]|nr:hypothetical protein [Chloroflexota bacterium]
MARLRISSALFLFALGIVFLQTILLNGYALNLLGLPASAETIFFLTTLEFIFLFIALMRAPIQIENDSLELAGFLFVVAGTFLYFVLPALPTFFAPSYSGDPALHLSFIYRVYSTGHIIGDDPGGPSLIAATIAHWLAIDPVRVMHPVAALWLALTAGAVYGIAGAVLPARAESKAIALGAAWALFIQGGIFSQLILGPNYFFS